MTKTHTITLIANLECGDVIAVTSFRGCTRITLGELSAHQAAGAVVTDKRRRA